MKKEWMAMRTEKPKLKRFYKTASVQKSNESWQVMLDGKPILTPRKNTLYLPTERLAETVLAEWQAQGEQIFPDTMPLTQFSCAAIDYVMPCREDVVMETVEYASTDALCYRADEPKELAEKQYTAWQPLIDWAERRYHIKMQLTSGVMPVAQDDETLDSLQHAIQSLTPFALTAVWLMAKHCSSLLLALTVYERRVSANEAYAYSRLEEQFQNDKWGEDEETRCKRESGEREMAELERFLGCLAAD